ncbi:gliding motility-associated C-terminal domain-containing protein [Lishizhenia tianjinensis]|uniref:Gliding motility-associated C-terminal domain-containing protein n=1 Tax=Lishizhenia tianjinensis TaxID=477690 RepID=A0A1I6X9G4_9FLAO|nr:gliding motility-associated C-terminal domain-containing protein [Lishizhenia tianjinensis]SFT34910.1 gliding motility-associated C-terminal domain-containing protein [Lishizhenia tianjinensis]
MKSLFSLLAILSSALTFGQFTMTGPDNDENNPLDCASIGGNPTNFTYDGSGSYPANANEVLTLCPDLSQGSKVRVAFSVNAGFTFDIDGSDQLRIYDGADLTAPLLGTYNSVTHPNGMTVEATWNNPSGCLTLEFISDGANQGTGWTANITCGNPPQPFENHIEAFINDGTVDELNPSDTGYVDVCLGDSILFVAKPSFPYSLENNGTGYSQSNASVNFDWTISGVGQFQGDSLWFTPPARTGYFVELRTTDDFPTTEVMSCKIRVSQLPNFAGAGTLEDTVCLGEITELVGGTTTTDTAGVEVPGGTFVIGGTYAGLTVLPDGVGASYSTTIPISGFGPGVTVQSASDIDSLILAMEHSYLGDLEVELECPNGTSIVIFNGNTGGGGGTFLGDDTDIDGGAPGPEIWTYAFSDTYANWSDLLTENANGNTIQNSGGFNAMNPNGVYEPQDPFSGFVGCPLDGPWTITVTDNLGIDDGYIFSWGLFFNQDLFPETEGYQNVIVEDWWTDDPAIVGGQEDTVLMVNPSSEGEYNFTFNVIDDFGCEYDTTVSFFVAPGPEIFGDTIACDLGLTVTGTNSYAGGVWSAQDTAIHFSPSENVQNPYIGTSTPGTYEVTYTDLQCNREISAQIYYPGYPWTNLNDTVLCEGVTTELWPDTNMYNQNYLWDDGTPTRNRTVTGAGIYTVTVSNECHEFSASMEIGEKVCGLTIPNVITPNGDNKNDRFIIQFSGVKDYEIIITNRWGNVVYESIDPYDAWDGTNKGGAEVSTGTYFYQIVAVLESGDELVEQGFVQLVR